MKTLENIEIYDITESGGLVTVDYSIDNCNITIQVKKSKLLDYVVDEALNEYYDTDDLIILDAETFLEENLNEVVKSYLEDNHAE